MQDLSKKHADKIFLQSLFLGLGCWILLPFVLSQIIAEKGYGVLLGIELGWIFGGAVGYFYYRLRSER